MECWMRQYADKWQRLESKKPEVTRAFKISKMDLILLDVSEIVIVFDFK